MHAVISQAVHQRPPAEAALGGKHLHGSRSLIELRI
jgi:hypothetical protein